jgi:hypothetical protein
MGGDRTKLRIFEQFIYQAISSLPSHEQVDGDALELNMVDLGGFQCFHIAWLD